MKNNASKVTQFNQNENEEYFVIVGSNAVIDPRAVMVESIDTFVALVAVSAP